MQGGATYSHMEVASAPQDCDSFAALLSIWHLTAFRSGDPIMAQAAPGSL